MSATSAPTTPKAASTVRDWLIFQDLTRRKSQSYLERKRLLHCVSLIIALLMVNATALSDWSASVGLSMTPAQWTGSFSLLVVLVEFCAFVVGERARHLNLLSRTSFAFALPASAYYMVPSHWQWTSLLRQADSAVTSADLSKAAENQEYVARLDKWWCTQRSESEPRLRAQLLESVLWTEEILNVAESRRIWLLRIAISFFGTALLIGMVTFPITIQNLAQNVIPPVLTFFIAMLGSGLLVSLADGREQLSAIRTALRGSDHWDSSKSVDAWTLFSSYVSVTSYLPPISSRVYEKRRNEIASRLTNEHLEHWLSGKA